MSKKELIVVLDLDETLIHTRSYKIDLYTEREEKRLPVVNHFLIEEVDETVPGEKELEGYVVHRPHVMAFLEHVTQAYKTYIFTGACERLANPKLDALEALGKIKFVDRWCDRTEWTEYKDGLMGRVKLLHKVPELKDNLDRVILVDNDPIAFLENPNNGLLCDSFYGSTQDATLPKVAKILDEMQAALLEGTSVPAFCQDRFNMKEGLERLAEEATQQAEESKMEQQVEQGQAAAEDGLSGKRKRTVATNSAL